MNFGISFRLEIKATRDTNRRLGETICRERISAMFQGSDLKEDDFKVRLTTLSHVYKGHVIRDD